jgi:hypothetical protein
MAIRKLTYFDIPQDVRSEAAARSRANLRTLLSNPTLTQQQRTDLLAQIASVAMWESGQLEIQGVPKLQQVAPKSNFGAP